MFPSALRAPGWLLLFTEFVVGATPVLIHDGTGWPLGPLTNVVFSTWMYWVRLLISTFAAVIGTGTLEWARSFVNKPVSPCAHTTSGSPGVVAACVRAAVTFTLPPN